MKLQNWFAGFLLVSPASTLLAQDPTNAELLKRVQELEQQVKVLNRTQELNGENAAKKAKSSTSVAIGSSGLTIRSADTNFVARIGAHVQVDGRFFPNSKSTTDDTFLVRKARPIIEGALYNWLD